MAKQVLCDQELKFSDAQAFSAAATVGAGGSTNEIDLGSTGMGEGVAIRGIVNVSGTGPVALVTMCSKATASVAVTDNPIAVTGSLSAGAQGHFTLPQTSLRYVKLFYTVTSAATVTAYLSARVSG